jgi:citrate synthase
MSTETQKQEAGGVDGAGKRDTLSVTDNRTGQTYELEISDGTVRAMDLRAIKVSDDDFGLMAYDPAFTNTASTRSEITYIDGAAGILEYRGYPIEQLCRGLHYLEVAYLLIHGELPNQEQLDAWTHEITIHTFVHENVKSFMQGFRYDAHPMGMLLASDGALSTFYPDANKIKDESPLPADHPADAKMPTLAAFAFRHNMGSRTCIRTTTCPTPATSSRCMYKMTELKYQPDPRLERALDVLFILHADHEQNCSTNAVRAVGSSQVDPYSAIAAGVAGLYGPLHGGANEQCLRMLRRSDARTTSRLHRRREGGQGAADGLRPPRLQELRPARADHQEGTRRRLRGHRHEPAARHRARAREASRSRTTTSSRKLYPNVDFYSGLIYEALDCRSDVPGAVRDRRARAAGSRSGSR